MNERFFFFLKKEAIIPTTTDVFVYVRLVNRARASLFLSWSCVFAVHAYNIYLNRECVFSRSLDSVSPLVDVCQKSLCVKFYGLCCCFFFFCHEAASPQRDERELH